MCWSPRPPRLPPAPGAHLGEVQLSSRAPGADDQVLGEEEALPLALLPQREGPQAPPRDFPLLRHRHLDEGPCETEAPSLAPPPLGIGGDGDGNRARSWGRAVARVTASTGLGQDQRAVIGAPETERAPAAAPGLPRARHLSGLGAQ